MRRHQAFALAPVRETRQGVRGGTRLSSWPPWGLLGVIVNKHSTDAERRDDKAEAWWLLIHADALADACCLLIHTDALAEAWCLPFHADALLLLSLDRR